MRIKLVYGGRVLFSGDADREHVNVLAILQSVKKAHPDIYETWCNQDGKLRVSLPVFVNGEHIRYRGDMETELRDGDEVYVIPMLSGG
jgi:adenylyltransferase/sulfurtransferase